MMNPPLERIYFSNQRDYFHSCVVILNTLAQLGATLAVRNLP